MPVRYGAGSVLLPLTGLTFSVLISFLFVSLITQASTTIGSNINTEGTLIVQGRINASSTLQATGAARLYSTLQTDGLTTLTNATTSLLTVSNGAWFTNGNIGISTTSPWGLLSINPNGISGPSFVVGSSTATNFVITNSGNVGLGTTSPGSLFSLNNIANFTTATSSFYGQGLNLANGCFAVNGTCIGAGGGTINSGTTGQLSYYAANGTTLTATSSLFIHSNQNIGIGTTTPNWLLQAAGTRPFFTLSDTGAAANNKHWFLSSQGGNFYVGTSSDAYATSTVSALTINSNGNVGISTTSPWGLLSINPNGISGSSFVIGSSTATNFVITNSGNVGIGTAAPSTVLQVVGNYMKIGDAGTVNFINGDGDLYIEDALEVDGTAYFNEAFVFNNLRLDANGFTRLFWDNVDLLHYLGIHLEMFESASDKSPVFIISDVSTSGVDLNFFDNMTEPSIALISDDASKYTRMYTEDDGDFVIKTGTTTAPRIILDTNNVGIGTTTPIVSFQVATSTANATTTIEVGKANQNKGSCLKMYDTAGTVAYCTVTGTTFSCSATSCE